jgi:hypothetical protein
VDEIARRFDHTTNSGVSDQERWGMPNVLNIVAHHYAPADLGALDSAFTGLWSANQPITPTVMMAMEQSYRALNLDQTLAGDTHMNWNANQLTIALTQSGDNAVAVETIASLKWTPYAYDPIDGWDAADISAFWDTLTAQLGDRYPDLNDPQEVATYHTMSQALYMAVYSGASYAVEIGDKILSEIYQTADVSLLKLLAVSTGKMLQVVLTTYFRYAEDLRRAAAELSAQRNFF